eukprot:358276-Chlamydomonas_euryale.AAC.4
MLPRCSPRQSKAAPSQGATSTRRPLYRGPARGRWRKPQRSTDEDRALDAGTRTRRRARGARALDALHAPPAAAAAAVKASVGASSRSQHCRGAPLPRVWAGRATAPRSGAKRDAQNEKDPNEGWGERALLRCALMYCAQICLPGHSCSGRSAELKRTRARAPCENEFQPAAAAGLTARTAPLRSCCGRGGGGSSGRGGRVAASARTWRVRAAQAAAGRCRGCCAPRWAAAAHADGGRSPSHAQRSCCVPVRVQHGVPYPTLVQQNIPSANTN